MTTLLLTALLGANAHAAYGSNDRAVMAPGAPAPVPVLQAPPPIGPVQQTATLPVDSRGQVDYSQFHGGDDANQNQQQSNPLEQIAPLLGSMMGNGGGGGAAGGGDRAASVGGDNTAGGGSSAVPSSGFSDAVRYSPETPKALNGQDMKYIDGCNGAGGWQFIFGKAGASCTDKDKKLEVNAQFSTFLNKTMPKCIAEAASPKSATSGKIFHAGTMGDARHQQTGSLHNLGLAIDINAIEIPGHTYKYDSKTMSADDRAFFQKFRQCWSKAAQDERKSCGSPIKGTLKNGQPVGTIGEENEHHRGHLHISLPLCPEKRAALGAYVTWNLIFSLFASLAHAEEGEAPPATLTRRNLTLASGVRAELTIRDQHGEPVSADHLFTVRVKCPGEAKPRVILDEDEGCDFISFTEAKGMIELRYLTSDLENGRTICRKPRTKALAPSCPVSKAKPVSVESTTPTDAVR